MSADIPAASAPVPGAVPAVAEASTIAAAKDEAIEGVSEAPRSEDEIKATVARLVAEGKKAVALKLWSEAVEKYVQALENQGELVDDTDSSMAPLLLSYGRALYELALSQQGVMGKEEVAKGTDPATGLDAESAAASSKGFVFEGDGDEGDAEEGEGEAEGGEEGEGQAPEGEEGAGGDDEPEDDFNAAWEVLDVARTIYAREVDALPAGEGKETRLLLADCYLSLGDVSCETENFTQAVQDYKSALDIQKAVLPVSSRTLASTHYQLGTALEFTPAGAAGALAEVRLALAGFQARAADLAAAAAGKTSEVKSDDIVRLSADKRAAEAKDVALLIGDLEVKIEELVAGPAEQDFVADSISHLLGGAPAPGSAAAAKEDARPVNDLTSMVRKKAPKKRAAPAPVAENGEGSAEKKAKTD